MILTVGNSGVYEVRAFNAVYNALKNKGYDAILFKQDKCLENDHLFFKIHNNNCRYYIIIDGKEYNIEEFSTIWYLKPHLPNELLNYKPAEHRSLISRQFEEMRQALWNIFKHKKWLNDPWSSFIAENKLYQLQIASQLNFNVPDTIITSDPNKVKNFYKNYSENIIVKIIRAAPILDWVIYTNKVTKEHISKIESIKKSPAIFQILIPKAYELRITVVGKKIFAVKIYSQNDEETSIDWRKKPKLNDFEVKMEPTIIPKNLEEQIFSFMKTMGLQFGCIDMIVTSKGEYIFLEINPNGQWYFVQLKTEMQIAEAIADLLIS